MSWSEVELDFGGDETCNFGPRIESGSPLYQVNTLATISHSGQVKKLPKVCSSLSSKGLCIAADQQVSAFDENCQKLLVILSFEAFVDVIKWSDDSTFLIIAERSGTVHFAHSGMGKILYSQTLLENVELDQECFVGAELCKDPSTDVWNFLVLTKGTFFRFPKISFDEINKAIKTGNMQAVQKMMVYSAVDVSSQHETTHSLTCYTQMDGAYAITTGTGDKCLAVWRLEAEKTELYQCIPSLKKQGEGFRKCIVYDDYIFAVDEKNVLSAFDKRSLIQVAHWSEMEIKDIILINYNPVISSNNTKADDVQMQAVAITTCEGECFLKVFSLPGMLCVYSLAISHHSYIAKMPPSYETIYLVEGTSKDEDETSGVVSTLRVRCLTEALPETRFHRLLHKGNFSEAEQFANLFRLDLQLVHKTRANHLMKHMTMEYDDDSEAEGMTGQIKELTDCLDQVTDERFIGTICSDVGLPTLTANQMLLDYAHNRLSESHNSDTADLRTELLEIMKRLKTFELVYGEKNFSLDKWNYFLQPNVAQELIQVLKTNLLSPAMALCLRHKEEMLLKMDIDTFKFILESIPTENHRATIPWLRDVLFPFVLRDYNDGKKLLVAWIEDRVRNMEIRDKTSWPSNGIELLQLFFHAYQTYTRIGQASGSDNSELIGQLQTLLGQLTGLKNLKERYNCYLSLQLYTQKDVTSIAFVMLDRVVAMELVSKVIKNQVKPYAEHNHLNFDKLLHQYITHHCNSFESRTIAISEYITDIELHLQSVLFMMKRAQLPWSKALQDLVQASLKVDHPVADQLRDNYKLIELGKMLSEYKLGHIDLRNLEFVEVAIYNILQRDGPSVVDHALQLVEIQNKLKPLDVYLIRMQSLLKQNKLDECFDLLHNLGDEMHVKCAMRMTTYGQTYLSEPLPWSLTKEDKQRRLTYCQATIKFLRILLKQSDASVQTVCEWTDLQRNVQCIQELQAEFGVFHYLHDDRSKQEKCEELLQFYNNYDSWKKCQGEEESFLGRNPQRPASGKETSSCKKISIITRFGKCLGLTEEEVKGHIAMEALKKRNLKEAISRCRDLCEPWCSKEGARVIFDVLQSICQLGGRCNAKQASTIQKALGSSTNLFKTLYDLGCIALTYAESDDICDLSELCKHLRFLGDLEKQCETGDYGNTVEIPDSETDAFSNPAWLMEDFFVEDSLVLESGQVLPKAGGFITSCIPTNHIQTTQYQDCRLLGMPVPTCQNTGEGEDSPNATLSCHLPKLHTTSDDLIQYLIDNQHHQLAFTVVVEAVMTGTAYLDANTMSPSLLSTQMKQGIVQEMKILKTLMGNKMVISENCASHLLDKIFEAENVDKSLALSFLLVLNKPTATKKLQQLETSAGFNYKKVMVIAEVGQEFAVVSLEDENLKNHYQQVQKLASWGQKLRKLKISFKEAFKKPVSAEFEKLLSVISTHHQVDFDLVKDFCRDFNLNADQAMLMFITQTLLTSSEQYKKVASVASHQELDVRKLEKAVMEIQDKNLLLNNLVDILQKVDSYDYERIGFILKTLKEQFPSHQEEAVNKQLELLAHLQVYKRISPPSVTEVSQQTSDDSEISDECKNRLPFHALLKPNVWKILSKELIDTTVEQLLPATQLLKLPSDQVYVTTIQNIILKTKENPAAANASQKLERGKSSVYLEMLEAIKLLLIRVENSQMAVATARAVAKEIPKGPEKVVAFKICIMLAENWVKTTAEDSQEREKAKVTLHYLEEKYRLLATERVLCKYNLDEAKHLQLVNSPKELIVILYQHESIVSRIKGEITTVPDIHTTAEAIAKINDCNLNEIHQTLLKRWLCKPTTTQEAEEEDMTVDISSINGMEKEDGSEEDEEKSLMRIKYLLQLQNPKERVELLLKMAYDESSTFSTKLRTLKCLFDMADSEMLENVSGKTCQQLWEHLQNVAYLSDLESLNFNLDLKTFLQANKQGLVRGMLRKHSQEPKALKLIADLCLKYEVMDVNLWNHLLQQMAKYNMFNDLESTLHCISTISDLQQIPSLGTIWWNMLLQPFKTVRAPLSEEEKAVCRKSLILLHSCPVTCDLDVVTLHNHFKKIDMLPEALACLFHLPVTEKSQSVQKFLKTVDSSELDSQLTALNKSHHLLPESQMIEEVLSKFERPIE